jgi:uncharacterized protein YvpB
MKKHVFNDNTHSALIAGVTKVYAYYADPSNSKEKNKSRRRGEFIKITSPTHKRAIHTQFNIGKVQFSDGYML